eukprot:830312-Amphidinium_carterae.1
MLRKALSDYHIRSKEAAKIGAIPSSLDAQAVFLRHNLLAGSIPHGLLGGKELTEKAVIANALESDHETHARELSVLRA